MPLTDQQRIMLDMAARFGGGDLLMPRDAPDPPTAYHAELADLVAKGLASGPTTDGIMGAVRYRLTQAGRETAQSLRPRT